MRRFVKAALITACTLCGAVVLLVAVFSLVNPPVTTLMLWRLATGYGIDHQSVSISDIAPELAHAVLTSEDNRFCDHRGIDWQEVEIVLDEVEERGEAPRGASTITMQTARTLFLWPHRSYVRKALEVPIALLIDALWSKRRILEVYLNIVEWGPGIYGAERAAQSHFSRPAARLTRGQAALLAASLPAPLIRNAGRPGPVTRRTAARVERRMAKTRGLFTCVTE